MKPKTYQIIQQAVYDIISMHKCYSDIGYFMRFVNHHKDKFPSIEKLKLEIFKSILDSEIYFYGNSKEDVKRYKRYLKYVQKEINR